jgi:hypothetical protein
MAAPVVNVGNVLYRRSAPRSCAWSLSAICLAAWPALAAAAGPVTRVAMMPLVDRTTIVVEFDRTPATIEEVADPAAVVVEAGPFTGEIAAQHLTAEARANVVDGVSIAPFARSDGATYARVRITLHDGAGHRLRRAGSRLYVDISPAPAASAVAQAPNTPPPARGETKPSESAAQADEASAVQAPAPAAPANPEAAYRAFDASARTRAGQMVARPDVKGLIRLRNEVERRDKELGNKQPDLVGPLLSKLMQMTDEARARQLERDRQSFLKDPAAK